jgi:flavocytochrome c
VAKERETQSPVSRSQFKKEEEVAKKAGKKVTRREFVKGAAVGAAGIAAAGALASCAPAATPAATTAPVATATAVPCPECPPPCPTPWIPEKWDGETDVLILGAGGAGLCAALEAYDAGVDVLVLEKSAQVVGSTGICGGFVAGAGTKIQEESGIKDDPELFYEDWLKAGNEMGDPSLIRAVTYLSGDTINWIMEEGVKLVEEPLPCPGIYSVDREYSVITSGVGTEFMRGLHEAAKRRGIEILLETPANKLFVNEQGRVIGARAVDSAGRELCFKAKRAVIVATGGYGSGMDAIAKYLPVLKELMKEAKQFVSFSWPECTGDGIEMAREIGVALSPNQFPFYGPHCVAVSPGRGRLAYTSRVMRDGAIYVNVEGKRYMAEIPITDMFVTKKWRKQPDLRFFMIFDQYILNQPYMQGFYGPLVESELKAENPNVRKGDTIEELAKKLVIPPEELRNTVDTYNGYVEVGEDPEFGRTPLPCKIEKPPFYCVELCCGIAMTKGGLKINTEGQAIDTKDEVVPGLYLAGEIASGGVQGAATTHAPGGGVAIAFNFGRIAGRNAAALEPWG